MAEALEGDFGGTFPFTARYVDAGGVRMHFVDEGPRDSAPLLLLHGNPTWSYMWRRPIAHLAEQGRRCVAPDHMGFGRSHKPARASAYTLERHVENLVALVEQLDLSDITLVAHDWGGPIGFGAAVHMPERFRAAVVMNTWAWELPSFLPPFLREFRTDGLGEILALAGNLMVEAIPGGMARREVDPVMMDAYRAPFPDYWSRLGTLAFPRDIAISEGDRSNAAMSAIHRGLKGLDLRMLILWGMRDPVFRPVFVQQWLELFPDARVTELEDAGHFLVEDLPDEVSETLHSFVTTD